MLEDTAAEVAQLPRPEHPSLLDQVGLGLHDQVVTQLVGKRLQRLDDHPGLGHVQVTGTESVGGLRPRRPERGSQRRVPAYGPVRLPGLGRQPRRGRSVTGRLGDVVGGGEHPQALGLRPRLINRETRSRNSCLSPVDRNSGPIARELVQPTLDQVERRGVRAGHRTIQAPTTDSPRASEPLVHKGFRNLAPTSDRSILSDPVARAKQPPREECGAETDHDRDHQELEHAATLTRERPVTVVHGAGCPPRARGSRRARRATPPPRRSGRSPGRR